MLFLTEVQQHWIQLETTSKGHQILFLLPTWREGWALGVAEASKKNEPWQKKPC